MDLKDLKKQINTLPNSWEPDRERVWFISNTQRDMVNQLIETIERYKEALEEIASEECQYTYCGAEYIAKQSLKESDN